jgi:UDP-GlcNAc:undecaprenyl-phosphate GlcNAc-1-phosphate transferase
MQFVLPFLVALGASAIGTPLTMWIARRIGAVAKPRADRWSSRATPLLGGVAIYVGFTATLVAFLPMTTSLIGLVAGSSAVFLLGLIDDLRPLRPSVKLAGQVAATCVIIPFGIHAIFVLHPVVAIPATLFWIVAMTNAFNLLDNMDGLSAGVSFISSCFTCLVSFFLGDAQVATAAAILAGSTLGFLIFNFPPAKVFMGDCGSLFLGFNLGSLTIMGTWKEASNLFLILLVPLLVLAVPLFDTALVTIMRKLSGRAISQGGRDHSSHRLVALGLSERNAVLLLYVVCAAFGGLALLGIWFDRFTTAVATGLLVVLILFFGVFLGEAKVYEGRPTMESFRRQSPLLARLLAIKWLILEFSTDLVLISAAYLGAYLIRFEGQVPKELLQQIHALLPIVLPIHIVALVFFGVYQEEWRYAGLQANFKVVKAVVVGGALSFVAVLLLTRFTFYSRAVFVISALLLTLLIMGSRSTLRLFREWFAARRTGGRRVLVVGAGDAGERVVRELRRHPELGLTPVAIVDDDPAKQRRKVHGVPVMGGCDEIPEVAERCLAQEIIFAIPSATGARRQRLLDACARAGVPYQMALGAREIIDGGGERLLRPVRVEDLVLRSRLPVEQEALRAAVRGKALLIVGTDSIAALELAWMAQGLGARRVVLADPGGPSLKGLSLRHGSFDVRLIHALEEGSVGRVLREIRPDAVVFACTLRTQAVAEIDLGGTLERNFLAVALMARECTSAGVRSFALWSSSDLRGEAGVALRLGEIAAAALGAPRVSVLRFPPVAEDPDSPLGEILEGAHTGGLPVIPSDRRVRLALAPEVACLTVQALGGEPGSEALELRVDEEPLSALAELALKQQMSEGGAPVEPSAPSVERTPLPRANTAAVETVERQVREALRAGRPEDALAAASLLVPGFYDQSGAGALVALDPVRRKSS